MAVYGYTFFADSKQSTKIKIAKPTSFSIPEEKAWTEMKSYSLVRRAEGTAGNPLRKKPPHAS